MRKFKWLALMASAGLLMQATTCATDFFGLVAQGLATQLAAAVVAALAGGGTA